MDETDEYCRLHSERLSHAQVFEHAREDEVAANRPQLRNTPQA